MNDDTQGVGYYAGYQYDPKAAMLSSGEMMVVWYDERNSCDYQVYRPLGPTLAGRIRWGTISGSPSSPATGADCPAVAACGGGFLVTWEDYRSGNDNDIYAQRYDASGSPIG